jgi:hypothetical protein
MTPAPTMSAYLAKQFPALAKYAPHLDTVSPQQALFLLLVEEEAFYGGAAGGGKSDALLMAALQYVDIPGYAALLLRRTYPELEKSDGLIPRAEEWLSNTDARRQDGGRKWIFPSGARLEFGHVKDEADKHSFQSAAYSFIGFDELTSFSESIYEYVAFSRTRRKARGAISRVPIRVRSASNPGNVGHLWVKERFVTKAKPGVIFIPAKVQDNPGLDVAQYRQTMSHLSEALQAQLLDGDWGAFEGAALTIRDDHLVDDFPLQDAHDRFEAADYGLNGAPWALWAVDYEGNLIGHDLLYESQLLPSQLAERIIEKRKGEWGLDHEAYVDPSIWHRTGGVNKWGRPAMLADEFTDNGVPVTRANNDPRAGLIRLRELLDCDPSHPFPNWHPRAGAMGAPRIFFVRSRFGPVVEELRSAPLQPIGKRDAGEIIDPSWEGPHGHGCAMTRYAVMTRPAPSVAPTGPPPIVNDARAAYVQQWMQKGVEEWDETQAPEWILI